MKKLSEKSLTNVALFYLRRHSATRKGLVQLLERKAKRQEGVEPGEVKRLIEQVVAHVVRAGYVDDVRMAESKTASLHRQGKSSRAIELKLREQGIDPELAKRSAISTPEQELEAAGMLVKKKRLGVDPERNKKDLGVLMRAGFGFDLAKRALAAVPAAQEEPEPEFPDDEGGAKVLQFPLQQNSAPELEAAHALVRKKNLGVDPARRQKDFAVLVRAGFRFEVAKKALALLGPSPRPPPLTRGEG